MEIKKNEINGIINEILGTIIYLLIIFITTAVLMR
jgi:hypothetical protein